MIFLYVSLQLLEIYFNDFILFYSLVFNLIFSFFLVITFRGDHNVIF